MKIAFVFTLASLAALAGCAANSGVIPIGKDMFTVSRQAATGGTLKAEAIGEANQFCGAQKKTIEVVSAVEAKPPYILGNYPKAEVQFKCV